MESGGGGGGGGGAGAGCASYLSSRVQWGHKILIVAAKVLMLLAQCLLHFANIINSIHSTHQHT